MATATTVALTGSTIVSAPALALPPNVSVHVSNAPLNRVLSLLSSRYHLNISFDSTVTNRVSADLRNVRPITALRSIVEPLGMRVGYDGSAYVVSPVRPIPELDKSRASSLTPTVITLSVLHADRAATIVRSLFPHCTVDVAASSNSLIVSATSEDAQLIRAVITGIDVHDPSSATTEALTLHSSSAAKLSSELHKLYPAAQLITTGKNQLVLRASPGDLAQIKAVIASLDTAPASAAAIPMSSDAIRVSERKPADIAKNVAHQFRNLRVAVSGSSIVVTGAQDDVTRAKALITLIDVPDYGDLITQVYRVHNVDATSVADLITQSFRSVKLAVDRELNAISVTGTAAAQERIASAITQLDGAGATSAATGAADTSAVVRGADFEVVQLQSLMPGTAQGSPTATNVDLATVVQQALQGSGSDVRVTALVGTTSLLLQGSEVGIRQAKRIIAAIDVVPQSVALDTAVFEVDESGSKNLGLLLPTAALGTTFSEIPPVGDQNGSTRLSALQAITRSPLSLDVQLNLLVQKGNARVLANPRITTLSGRTATIRSGDTLGILTTVGGGAGTTATSQLQTFQTGVTLDITPLVTPDGQVTISLHPVVNSLSGILNGVPQISTRDAQTIVHVHDNEALAIGGLIQENSQRTENRIPGLGDIPLIGSLFRNTQTSSTTNELVIVVTPHILPASSASAATNAAVPHTPRALPTLPPGTTIPMPTAQNVRVTPTVNARETNAHVNIDGRGTNARVNNLAATGPLISSTATPEPSPIPSDLAQTNVFTYGAVPTNTYASSNDAITIYYARFSPTVLKVGTPVTLSVVTSTNVQQVQIGPPGYAVRLSPLGGGRWTASYPFSSVGLPLDQAKVQLTLTASKGDGGQTNIQIPVSIVSP